MDFCTQFYDESPSCTMTSLARQRLTWWLCVEMMQWCGGADVRLEMFLWAVYRWWNMFVELNLSHIFFVFAYNPGSSEFSQWPCVLQPGPCVLQLSHSISQTRGNNFVFESGRSQMSVCVCVWVSGTQGGNPVICLKDSAFVAVSLFAFYSFPLLPRLISCSLLLLTLGY